MGTSIRYIAEAARPSAGAVDAIKKCAGAFGPDSDDLLPWHQSYGGNHATRLAFDLDILCNFTQPGARVLEVGSAPFIFTLAASQRAYAVSGCDLEPSRYSRALTSHGLQVAKCDVETEPLPFSDESFDVVIFNEIFEHLRINPIFTLSQVRRVLNPNGTLMLSSPNLRSLEGIRNFLLRNKAYSCCSDQYTEYQKLERLGHMGHVREYTHREVSDFLTKCGFQITHLIFRGEYYTTPKRVMTRFFPSLRPFASYIARKHNL